MSRGPGHIEQAIGILFERQRENLGKVVWVSVEVVARVTHGTAKPTHAQRVAIRRAMHAFVRRHYHFNLDGGWGRTSLHVAGLAGEKPVPRKQALAEAPRIPAELSKVGKWRRHLREEF